MNGRADTVGGSYAATCDPEYDSGVGPAPRPYVSGWTMGSYLELGALPSAVPSARLHARLVVGEWRLGEIAEDVELIVSELVTNAMQASQGLLGCWFNGVWAPGPPPVRLWLQADQSRVLIQVWDGCERMPQTREAELYGESGRGMDVERGRGLLIVEGLCERYGVYLLEGCSGKVVWGDVTG